jgi:hypothetical protein
MALPHTLATRTTLIAGESHTVAELGAGVAVATLLRAATAVDTARLNQDRTKVRLATDDPRDEETDLVRIVTRDPDFDVARRQSAQVALFLLLNSRLESHERKKDSQGREGKTNIDAEGRQHRTIAIRPSRQGKPEARTASTGTHDKKTERRRNRHGLRYERHRTNGCCCLDGRRKGSRY